MSGPQPVPPPPPLPPHPTQPTTQEPYQPAPVQQHSYQPPPAPHQSHQSYQPPPSQPSYQGQDPHNVQAPPPAYTTPPAQPQKATFNPVGEDINTGKVGYFFFGMAMSAFLGVYSFFFFCCSENIGLSPSRRMPFIVGIIVGTLLQWIIIGIIIGVAVSRANDTVAVISDGSIFDSSTFDPSRFLK